MIELNKVYTEGNVFRTPITIKDGILVYWFTSNQEELGKEVVAGYMSLDVFEKTHTIYTNPMTFKRIKDEGIKKIKDEGIKKIVSPNDVTREVIGFSSNNKLITYTYGLGATSWFEEEIKDWKVVE